MTSADVIDLGHTDRELLRRSRARDQQAFTLLVDRHKNLTVNYLTRLTGSRERAEELAQETFVRFYGKLASYREEGQLTAYLLRIATNLVRSQERRARRWQFLQPLLRSTEGGRASVPSPQTEALAAEARRVVTDAIAELPLRYRAPLVLREIEGLAYRDIALALACQEGTVKSRLHRARQLLRQQLEPYWNGDRHHAPDL